MNDLVTAESKQESNFVSVSPDTPVAQGVSPLVMMLASGQLKPENIKDAMMLQREHDEYEAKKAYSLALSKFRKMAPTLLKNKTVDFSSQKGRTHYNHTSLGYALTEVNPLLGECDLNLSWHPRQEGGIVYVVTRLTHCLGHFEEIELQGAPDNTGNKNPFQAVSSAITYMERVGAFAILGLASSEDDDADSAAPRPHPAQAPAPEKRKVFHTKEQEASFNQAVKDSDGYKLIDLSAETDAWSSIFSNLADGRKTSTKDTVRKIMADTRKEIEAVNTELMARMEADDKPGAVEVINETPFKYVESVATEELTTWVNDLETEDGK